MLSKHNFGIKTHLQIISTNAAQILYQHMGNLSGFYGCNHAFPIRAVKVCARPAVISKVDTIRKSMLLCIIFKQLLLRRDLSRYVFVTECAIRIDKQQKERYNNVVIDNDIIV